MKVITPGRPQDHWSLECICSTCNAVLLVEEKDAWIEEEEWDRSLPQREKLMWRCCECHTVNWESGYTIPWDLIEILPTKEPLQDH